MYFRTVEISGPRFEHDGIRHMTVKSPALRRRGDLSLYVHPALNTLGCECVLILLNGVYNSHWGWLYHAGVHRTARRLIDSGAMRPMLLAMPSDGLWGDGSAYIAHGQEDAERWIMHDVLEACRLAVPTLHPSPRLFLAGLSMGGYGALRLGAKWADAVSGISAHSAITDIVEMQLFAEEPLPLYLHNDVARENLTRSSGCGKIARCFPRYEWTAGSMTPSWIATGGFTRACLRRASSTPTKSSREATNGRIGSCTSKKPCSFAKDRCADSARPATDARRWVPPLSAPASPTETARGR
jgi:hypothetical protein